MLHKVKKQRLASVKTLKARPHKLDVLSHQLSSCDPDMIKQRTDFVKEFTGIDLHHARAYSFDPAITEGSIENFTGISQIPMGFAGPLLVKGEHARGEFVIPLCTSEGTLVASYNRGMKIMNMCGGVKTTILEDHVQKAPAFVFASARKARAFMHWLDDHKDDVRRQTVVKSSVCRLQSVEKYLAAKTVYLRLNFMPGDDIGPKEIDMATFQICSWILTRFSGVLHYYLASGMATEKAHSSLNTLSTHGKKVVAEVIIPREIMLRNMRTDPDTLDHLCRVGGIGAFMAGASNNGLHAANALAALFVATGQDVSNIAVSSSGILYSELTPHGDLYGSITLPSLMVKTCGGGADLPTQRECLEILGCYGPGKALKFAEIVAAVVAAGELSLAGALSSLDWVTSHERLGKNR